MLMNISTFFDISNSFESEDISIDKNRKTAKTEVMYFFIFLFYGNGSYP